MQETASAFDPSSIKDMRRELREHPVYDEVSGMEKLRTFMEHHVYSVWDFMSLAKYLQGEIAPVEVPWAPREKPELRRFVNTIILEEESDEDASGESYASHFELYCRAMEEVGADPSGAEESAGTAFEEGIDAAFETGLPPEPSRRFVETTFSFIETDKPHKVAAAFAFGREKIIPEMFRSLLDSMGIGSEEAPAFRYYLERHIHLDETSHSDLAVRTMEELVGEDPERAREAEEAAASAVEARIEFWDGVREAL